MLLLTQQENFDPEIPTVHSLEITIYDAPALVFPLRSGITVPANTGPDVSIIDTVIPLHLTSYKPPKAQPTVNVVTSLPLIDEASNLAYGGNAISEGAPGGLPRVTIEGHIDTPCINQGEFRVPNIVLSADNSRITYGEFIIASIEGRMNVTSANEWRAVNPLWFRDPFGRIYNNPKIIEFSASYVEGVPGRTQFSCTMVV